MKILSLSFSNLNSLKGRWKIDFSQAEFKENGLFAIVGATGAGKTTLLDAICLALYHQTPRLGQINQTSNQIMSRGCADCWAEVEFQVKTKSYRASWSMRRARGKANGKLQPADVELAEVSSGKILASQIKIKSERVEQITGLDFARFTRSMMLSQGQFAAFLNAKEDERAALLEELTGTDVYRRISERVSQERTEAKQHLEQLQARLSGIALLSAEQRQELAVQIKRLEAQIQNLHQDIEQLDIHLSWWAQKQSLTQKQQEFIQQRQTIQEQYQQHQPDLARLDLAEQAEKLRADWQQLQVVETQNQSVKKQLLATSEKLDALDPMQRAATQQMEVLANHTQSAQKALEQCHDLIQNQLNPLEGRIQTAEESLQAKQTELEKLKSQYQQNESQLNQWSEQKTQLNKTLHQLDDWLESNNMFAGLPEQIPAWQIRSEYLKQQHAQVQVNEQKLKALTTELTSLAKQLQQLAEQRQQLFDNEKIASEHLESLKLQWHQQSQQGDKTTLTQQQEDMSQKLAKLLRLQEIQRQWLHYQEEESRLTPLVQTLSVQKESKATQVKDLRELYVTQEQLVRSLASQLSQEQVLSEYRQHLSNGESCPLCGSTAHPLKAKLPNEDAIVKDKTEAELQLSEITERGKQARDELEDLTSQHNSAQSQLSQAQTQLQQTDQLWHKEIALENTLAGLPLENKQELLQLQTAYQQQLDDLTVRLQHFDELQQQLHQAEKDCVELKSTNSVLESEFQALQQRKQHLSSDSENLAVETAKQKQDLQDGIQQLRQSIRESGVALPESQGELPNELSFNDKSSNEFPSDDWFATLKTQADDWQEKKHHSEKMQLDLQALTSQITTLTPHLTELQSEVTKQDSHTLQLSEALQQLNQQRFELVGDSSAEQLLSEKSTALEEQQKATQRQQQKLTELDKQRNTLSGKCEGLQQQHDETRSQLKTLAEKLEQKLDESVFKVQSDFVNALLDPIELESLQALKQTLQEQQQQLQTLSQANETNLQVHLEHKPCALSLKNNGTDNDIALPEHADEYAVSEYYQTIKSALQKDHQAQLQKLGEFNNQLQQDDQQKLAQQNLIREIDDFRENYDDIQYLYDLIGHSKGEKFRKFAQGLTLDNLIHLANRRLQQLHGRYQLTREQATLSDTNEAKVSGLNMNVIDTWQADTKRDSKTLSGGESFLVSLALALGLSDLVSHKTQIESLFLDEGFGTLDAETLDLALDTLDNLNATGKTIGVISHIEAMKERIPLQIKVMKKNGLGVSELESRYQLKD